MTGRETSSLGGVKKGAPVRGAAVGVRTAGDGVDNAQRACARVCVCSVHVVCISVL